MDEGSVFLIVVGALIIAVIWYFATRGRTDQQRRYSDLAERTERTLGEIQEQLVELSRRTGEVERILKDAE
jgi:type VI protein secretion system component VasK